MSKTLLSIGPKYWEMEQEQAIEIMKFGKEKLERGIYGVYKEGYAFALLERYSDPEDLKKAVLNYQLKGFTVLYNE